MMSQSKASEQEAFQNLLENFYKQASGSDALQKIKAKAWDHFLELGLPTGETEVYKYIRLRNLFSNPYVFRDGKLSPSTNWNDHILPECNESHLVFVNGHFKPEMSNIKKLPKQLVISTLQEATKTYGAFLNNQWAKTMKEETDPFAIINAALHRDGSFIYIPPKTIVDTPIQLIHLIDVQDEPVLIMPRLHLFLGSQAQAKIISSQAILSGNNYCSNCVVECAIEEDAHLQYMQNAIGQPQLSWSFDALRATLKRNSTLTTICATDGSATTRFDYRIALAGENAEALLNGVWMLAEKNEAHTHVIMDHQAPHCRSLQLYKGALNDISRSSFEGKILVRQAAQKTEAFQLNNNLLLSDYAIANSKPNLEIFADDVKASHGSTVGQLDKEQLFYMKTRGFSEAEGANLLVHAYCQEVIDKISVPSLKRQVGQFAQSYVTK
jgi:Fe-S cluster assembly protein SufD